MAVISFDASISVALILKRNAKQLCLRSNNAELMDSSHAFRSDTWAGPLGKTKAGQRYQTPCPESDSLRVRRAVSLQPCGPRQKSMGNSESRPAASARVAYIGVAPRSAPTVLGIGGI